MFSIIHSFYITSGITFFIAFHFFYFSLYGSDKKLYLYFSCLSFFAALFQLYCGDYYGASSFEDAVYALKWQLFAGIGFVTLLYFFLSEYTGIKINKSFAIFLLLTSVVATIENANSLYSLRFETITTSSTFLSPWGEKITTYFGTINPFMIFLRILYISILVWGGWCAKHHFKKNKFESVLLGVFLVSVFFTAWMGHLIDTHKINFVYIPGFAYFFLVIGMTTSLGMRIFTQHKKLEQTTLQLYEEIQTRKGVEENLLFNSQHDELTGLSNRQLLLERFDLAIKLAKGSSSQVAILFLDLDHFKEINDSLGHIIGDKVLLSVTKNIVEEMGVADYLSRLGGDEFCLLLPSINTPDDASNVALKLLGILGKSIHIDEHELYISGSIGISVYPNDGNTPIELLRNADAAMYKAKQNRNHYEFYTEEMTKLAFERVSLETSIRQALLHEEFIVHYQPQMDGQHDRLIGMEALVRWNHPKLGLVPPSAFIPFAEETGLIVFLDRWVMRTAMNQVVQWYEMGFNPGILAINLSVKQLRQEDFILILNDLCSELNFKTEWLELEITESQIMDNPEKAITSLNQISQKGIKLAIDDFGTGYSSLSYLKRLPIDKLKIDKTFIDGLPTDEEDASIVRAIIALAQSMKLNVIAEGVETAEQKDFLVQNGCKNIQGYFYAKPMPANDIEVTYFT
ncbi:MAG: EAL domain-containing protein [Sulfuricurvum sp.]|uniref:putative bifunctional diguanylate cyclase/phosphodiesterase n=1 Tax=Sulfuricurvum sp. TaxID=2025608 RepID=UPI0026341B8A|nr:EAL domain-containing protein [Sulfuricurvum sp.]MDD2951136.1 EAL domain-containing protein [Sulfuricurvum sp.]MDD5117598.1 EAL domain-containing protein [Sulfuricurvum sp.]